MYYADFPKKDPDSLATADGSPYPDWPCLTCLQWQINTNLTKIDRDIGLTARGHVTLGYYSATRSLKGLGRTE